MVKVFVGFAMGVDFRGDGVGFTSALGLVSQWVGAEFPAMVADFVRVEGGSLSNGCRMVYQGLPM